MSISLRDIDLRVLNMRARMPFRYGIASLVALPHLFVRVAMNVDGIPSNGTASDGLPPKWFTKDPDTGFEQDLRVMLGVIEHACELAKEAGEAKTPFEWWRRVFDAQTDWGWREKLPLLLTGFGASLVERAMIDAFCRAKKTTFAEALRANLFGIRLGDLHAELEGQSPARWLAMPLRKVIARHTVGLSDPITAADIAPGQRVDDGLPQSLEDCIRTYGLTHFKIKLCGDLNRDLPRLRDLAKMIPAVVPGGTFAFTLDGNEQFHSIQQFREAWSAIHADPAIGPILSRLIFVEQPLHRDVALSEKAMADQLRWPDRPLMIIDESDATIGSLPTALAGGYCGTSHKNCKGVFKGIASACLIAHRQSLGDGRKYVLSGEDLANVGPIALLQDLAVSACLGIDHIERNGHHYFRGLSMYPSSIQEAVLQQHGDLYQRHAAGFATLRIAGGKIDLGSLIDAPFGCGVELDLRQFTKLSDWRFASLNER
jgi:hypothetical protein